MKVAAVCGLMAVGMRVQCDALLVGHGREDISTVVLVSAGISPPTLSRRGARLFLQADVVVHCVTSDAQINNGRLRDCVIALCNSSKRRRDREQRKAMVEKYNNVSSNLKELICAASGVQPNLFRLPSTQMAHPYSLLRIIPYLT